MLYNALSKIIKNNSTLLLNPESISFCSFSKNSIAFIESQNKKKFVLKIFTKNWERENEQFFLKTNHTFSSFLFLPVLSYDDTYIFSEYIISDGYYYTIHSHEDFCLDAIFSIIEEIDNACDAYDIPYLRSQGIGKKRTLERLEKISKQFPDLKKYKKIIEHFDESTLSQSHLIHGDFRLANLLKKGDSTYLLDWERLAKSDRNVDYALMYESICYHAPQLADKFFMYITTRPLFDLKKFIYLTLQEGIDYLFNAKNLSKETKLFSVFKNIDSLL